MHSFLSRLQIIWQSICKRFNKLVTAAIATPERCVTLSLFALALFMRLYQLDAALIGESSAPYLGFLRETLTSSPWTTATSQLLLGLISTAMGSLTGTLVILGLLNSLSVALVTRTTSRWFGVRTGAVAGLLLCFNPWGIMASRTIGPAALLLPAGVLMLWGLELALSEKKQGGWVLALGASGLACGVHAAGLILPAVCLLICLVFARRVSWRHAGVGFLWGLLLAIPPFYALNAVGWAQNGLVSDQTAVTERLYAWVQAIGGGGLLQAFFEGAGAISLSPALQTSLQVWGWLAMVALPVTAYLSLWAWAHWRKKLDASNFAAIALIGTFTVVGLMLLPASADPTLYCGLLSANVVGAALMIDALMPQLTFARPAHLNAGMLLLIALMVLFGLQLYTTLAFYEQANTEAAIEAKGMPLRYWKQVAGMAERCVGESTSDRVWILGSARGDSLLIPEIIAYEAPDIVLVLADEYTTPVALDDTALVLAAPDRQITLEAFSTACGKVLLPNENDAVWLDELAVIDVTTLPIANESEAITAAPGITYLGYKAISDEITTEITVYWRRTPDAATDPITLYMDDTLLGQLTPGERAPENCVTLATTLSMSGMIKTHTLWTENGTERIELDIITITES